MQIVACLLLTPSQLQQKDQGNWFSSLPSSFEKSRILIVTANRRDLEMSDTLIKQFVTIATRIGALVTQHPDLGSAVEYISRKTDGVALVPPTTLADRFQLKAILKEQGVDVFDGNFRKASHMPAAGVTFSNFAMADSGTVVLDSTAEEIRFATTIPEKHFIFVDPATILADNLAAGPVMTDMHRGSEPKFIAYISGPSRTADIERVLTIGCHGPRELHILIVEGISADLLEN
jgi:L-lactate dehydrogenase complex protein LldG